MSASPPNSRCGIDSVEISRIEKLLAEHSPEELRDFFSEQELQDAGTGAGRAASLAARFAAKEACCKLFPKETALGKIEPCDFSVLRDSYGEPSIRATPAAQAVMDRHRLAAIRLSLTHTDTTASAVALAELRATPVSRAGKFLYHYVPYRRALVLESMRKVFGDAVPAAEIEKLAQAYYGHYATFAKEFVTLKLMSKARRQKYVRVENKESPLKAHGKGRGLLLLTGHFGNWEVSTSAAIKQFPEYKGLFYFVRRPIKPQWLNNLIAWRDRRNGFGTLAKSGSLDQMLDLLSKGAIIVFVYDQHAGGKDGVVVDFLGHPAGTFKSLALLAMTTGAPVIPASSWREPDGSHVLRFEDPLEVVEGDNVSQAIRENARRFNDALGRMLLRHPEQWIWMHRRWKV
ncbi:MAG: 4'-phosphopantetheinyl transferase superfamily protein [Verrucomicrobiota bacterium]